MDDMVHTYHPPVPLTQLERDIITFLLTGEHPNVVALREQLATCMVSERHDTLSGFFTTFQVSERHPLLLNNEGAPLRRDVSGPEVHTADCPYPAQTQVFFSDGQLMMIECYGWGGIDGKEWTGQPTTYHIKRHRTVTVMSQVSYRWSTIYEICHAESILGPGSRIGFWINGDRTNYRSLEEAKAAVDNANWLQRAWLAVRSRGWNL